MNKKLKPVPHFQTEAEERAFWESHDTADYFDLSNAQRANLPNLKTSSPQASPPSLLACRDPK
jgi:hypothetical protein